MKVYPTLFLLFIFITASSFPARAQRMADPDAAKILKSLKTKYDSFESIEIKFNLDINIPDEEESIQEGTLIQQREKYKIDLPDQVIYSNGKVLWVHLIKNEEVQINDLEEDGAADLLSPKDLLNMYNSKEFDYIYLGQTKIDGNSLHQIEFKPLDDFSDYSKIRMYSDPINNELVKVIVFSKDGARYTMTIKNMITNQKYTSDIFIFDKSKYPKIHVEDLRID